MVPIDKNHNSAEIIQKHSKQCKGFEENVASETEKVIKNLEDEEPNNESESEIVEKSKEEKKFWKRDQGILKSEPNETKIPQLKNSNQKTPDHQQPTPMQHPTTSK